MSSSATAAAAAIDNACKWKLIPQLSSVSTLKGKKGRREGWLYTRAAERPNTETETRLKRVEKGREKEPAISAAAAATTYTEALSLLEKVGKLLLLLLERKNLAREKTEEDEANYDYH